MYVVLQHCFRLGGGEVLNISVLMLVLFISQKDQMKMYRLLKKKWGGGSSFKMQFPVCESGYIYNIKFNNYSQLTCI